MNGVAAANRASAIAGRLQHAVAVGKISRGTVRELLREIETLKMELTR